jgi:predicted esterase
MTPNYLSISKTARYFTIGEYSSKTRNIWLVLHGYGQLAETFLKNFEIMADDETLIVAPEGIHRFYVNGNGGAVGASWMTKEDRLNDIADNNDYLEKLLEWILEEQINDEVKIHVLGFSQGTSTACRWLVKSLFKATSLVLWAGTWPQDITKENVEINLSKTNLFAVLGNRDEFADHSFVEKQLILIADSGLKANVISFEGGHRLDSDTLLMLKERIGQLK